MWRQTNNYSKGNFLAACVTTRSNMFRFTLEPSSGGHNQYLAKITNLVQLWVSVQTLSVLWRNNTDSISTDTHSWTRFVILAKYWLWVPEDGSYVSRNMLERLL